MEQKQNTVTNEAAKAGDMAAPRKPERQPGAEHEPGHLFMDRLHAMGNLHAGRWLQAKLKVGQANDAFEQEADRVADTVIGSAEPVSVQRKRGSGEETAGLQRKCASCEAREREETVRRKCDCAGAKSEEDDFELQRKANGDASGGSLAAVDDVLRMPGRPLDAETRGFMESRFAHDFSDVRVHTDARAAESARGINALAYTAGSHVVFGANNFEPGTTGGRRLLAHELTHVVQQGGGNAVPGRAAVSASPGGTGTIQRAISPELDKIEDYLSYGLFDWEITDNDAINALEMLKKLPSYQLAVFFSEEKYSTRLRENLPANRIPELDALEAGVAGTTAPKSEIAAIESNLSYGIFDWAITDAEAVDSLERLKKLPDPQLAVALGAINYDRLMDNLPDNRKQELLDLTARVAPRTGGLDEPMPPPGGGAMLNAISFKSDHGVMKDNDSTWENSGVLLGEPEWFVKGGIEVSKPISQTRGTSVEIDVNLNLPPTPKPEPITITGKSDAGLLNFSYTGNVVGGPNRRFSLTSEKKLPNVITDFPNEHIEWTINFHNGLHVVKPQRGHTVYVTMDTPRSPGEATVKRMAKAVQIVYEALEMKGGSIDPHTIVSGIMDNWNNYDLSVPMRSNIWTFADEIDKGGQCIDIVRFITAIIEMIGCPGDADPVVIWAHPDHPDDAIEQLYQGPVGLHTVGPHPAHHMPGDTWFAGLLDGSFHSNAYEAALRFKYGGKLAYYAGGAGVYHNKDEVLKIFRCLAWIEGTGGMGCKIMAVPGDYDQTCKAGDDHVCFVPQPPP